MAALSPAAFAEGAQHFVKIWNAFEDAQAEWVELAPEAAALHQVRCPMIELAKLFNKDDCYHSSLVSPPALDMPVFSRLVERPQCPRLIFSH